MISLNQGLIFYCQFLQYDFKGVEIVLNTTETAR